MTDLGNPISATRPCPYFVTSKPSPAPLEPWVSLKSTVINLHMSSWITVIQRDKQLNPKFNKPMHKKHLIVSKNLNSLFFLCFSFFPSFLFPFGIGRRGWGKIYECADQNFERTCILLEAPITVSLVSLSLP